MSGTGNSWQAAIISRGDDVTKRGGLRAVSIREALDEIRTGKDSTETLTRCRKLAAFAARTASNDDTAAYRAVKTTLPYFVFSGVFNGRRTADSLARHSGAFCIDLDHLTPDRVSSARAKLIADKRTASVFLSPSALGLKVLIIAKPVPQSAAEHKIAYAAAQAVVATVTGEELDDTSDVCRACFLSEDRSMFVREKPVPVSWSNERHGKQQRAIAARPQKAAKDLPRTAKDSPPLTSHTHLSAMHSAHRRARARAGVVADGEMSREWQRIAKRQNRLYRILVKPRTAPPGRRNAMLKRLVPLLTHALAPEIALRFLARQYDQLGKPRGWAATRGEHLTSARTLLNGSLARFPSILSDAERAIFDKLSNETACALFRIARALARYDGSRDGLPVGIFAMSSLEAAGRLGCSRTRAAHWLAKLVTLGILRRELNGAVWCANSKPRATVWRWLFCDLA